MREPLRVTVVSRDQSVAKTLKNHMRDAVIEEVSDTTEDARKDADVIVLDIRNSRVTKARLEDVSSWLQSVGSEHHTVVAVLSDNGGQEVTAKLRRILEESSVSEVLHWPVEDDTVLKRLADESRLLAALKFTSTTISHWTDRISRKI